eukprot:TRINITY_DN3986_c0_g2_i1.p1 TRINITY_DN3986_c0_g2~~TRINITY_DN3986_c0_g2_i1.p1  ORF type:complete len:683 (+),score=71.02 TRINITY_DN3986_c0_g2_i1:113-2161(+)
MDSGYSTEEEWAPNPYQAELEAYFHEMRPQLPNESIVDKPFVSSSTQSLMDDSSQDKTYQTLPRRYRGPYPRKAIGALANKCDVDGLCSNQTTFASSFGRSSGDTVSGTGGSMDSRSGSEGGFPPRPHHVVSSHPDDSSFALRSEESKAVSGMQSPSDAWKHDGQLVKSRCQPEGFIGSVQSRWCDASAFEDTSHHCSFDENIAHFSTKLGQEMESYHDKSVTRCHDELKQYPNHHEQDVASCLTWQGAYLRQHELRTAPECSGRIQMCDQSSNSSSNMDMNTWNQSATRESHLLWEAQSRLSLDVNAQVSRDASAEATRTGCDFSKDRLREVLIQGLLGGSDCIDHHIQGWDDVTARIVILGVMENFARQGSIHHTEKCAELMLRLGPSPVLARTFSIMIAACTKHGKVTKARHWWSRVTSLGIKPARIAFNSMIGVCARSGDMAEAEWWMQEMLSVGIEPCLVSFTTLVVACGQAGSYDKAEYWFQKMHAYGLRGDAVLYNAMFNACVKLGNVAKAEALFHEMQAEGVAPIQRTFNILIHAFAKCGNMQQAMCWHRKMQEFGWRCDEYTYGSLLEGCARFHDTTLAEDILLRMFSEKLKPNLVCLRSLIKVYGSMKDGDRLARVLSFCMHHSGVSPQDVQKALKSKGARLKSKALEELCVGTSMTNAQASTQPAHRRKSV